MPVSRAALKLADEGLDIVFGDATRALRAICGGWQRVEAEPTAVHDRFPSWTWPEEFSAATAPLEGLPFGNPIAFRDLCRDKVLFQEHVGLPMPDVVTDPEQFEAALEDWGAAFLKPRFGGLGRGVRRVVPGDPLPRTLEGAVAGVREPSFLQRAVPPPPGLAGLSSRWLWQREPGGAWTCAGGVARISKDDPVTNVDRGARVAPVAEAMGPATLREAHALCRAVCARLEDPCIVEVGLDLVVDHDGHVHLIEANSRPGGRLRALGPRFHEQHVDACARPLRALHELSGATSDRPGRMVVS
jgi:glutathione synthase/RimK-type ligase-like ATP-grasp enzyme